MKAIYTILLAASLTIPFTLGAEAEDNVLTVYTYDSFVTEWGPGPSIKQAFEKQCHCTLKFVAPGDATETFNRLRLEGKKSDADVLVGLDSSLLADAEKSGLFAPNGLKIKPSSLPIDWNTSTYIPFDWGYFAFVYNENTLPNPPKSFDELLNAPQDLTLLIEDPRSSTPGLGLLLWVKSVYGDKAESIWQKLAPRIVTVTKGWSEAYGMFLEGQAKMVLSYTTSPAYHIEAEGKTNYKAAPFVEGHYMQVELAAMTKSSDHKELAKQFLSFLSSPESQRAIPTTNWMYPANMASEDLPDSFKELAKPDKALLSDPEKVPALRKQALNEWLAALSH